MWLVTRHQHRLGEHDVYIRAIDGALFLRSVVRSLLTEERITRYLPLGGMLYRRFP